MPTYKNSDFISVMRPLPKDWPAGPYDIPFIKKEDLPISLIGNGLFLSSINNASPKDKGAARKIIHSFSFDPVLKRCYEKPLRFLERTSPYYGLTSPDFSMHFGMKEWQIIDATAKSRWLGAFCQAYGRRVYPTVGWVDEKTYDICFAGLEDGSTFFVSTLGTNNKECDGTFHDGFTEMRRRFPHSRVICLGQRLPWFQNDVCVVPYSDSFGNFDKCYQGWQGKLFNWDSSMEGC